MRPPFAESARARTSPEMQSPIVRTRRVSRSESLTPGRLVLSGALLMDGGLTGRAPVIEALKAGVPVARVLVAMSYAPEKRGQRPTTMRRAIEEAFEMRMIHQIRRDVELPHPIYRPYEPAIVEMRIPLRAPDISMAQRTADQDEVLRRAVAKGAKGVAERMDRECSPDASAAEPEGKSVFDGAWGERPSAPRGENGRWHADTSADLGTKEPGQYRAQADRQVPALHPPPLRLPKHELPTPQVEIVELQPDDLGQSDSRVGQRGENGVVTNRERVSSMPDCSEEPLQLGAGHVRHEGSARDGRPQVGRRVLLDETGSLAPAKERADDRLGSVDGAYSLWRSFGREQDRRGGQIDVQPVRPDLAQGDTVEPLRKGHELVTIALDGQPGSPVGSHLAEEGAECLGQR